MISELSDATSLQNTDLIPLARGATTLKVSGLTLASSLTAIGAGSFALKTDLTALSSTSSTSLAGLSATVDAKFIPKPASASAQQVLTYNGSTATWVASAAPGSDGAVGVTAINTSKAWVNFNGASAFYTSGNTVTYVANSPSAGQTTVTVDRTATWSPLPVVGDWVTVSGVTGATAVNGTFQITEVDNVAFNIKYIVPSVVTGTVGGTAFAYIVAIRSSYNVSSVTKNGTGDYTVNFSTPMADANYSVVFGAGETVSPEVGQMAVCSIRNGSPLSQNFVRMTVNVANGNINFYNTNTITASIFGN